MTVGNRIGGLVRSSHPGPCLGITAMTVLLAWGAGADHLFPFAVSVLAGQLSIGWSNDVLDADLDRRSGRTDKPVAAGTVSARAVLVAAFVALLLSFGIALALGWVTLLWSLVVVGAGWAYNLGLKRSVASGLMYILGFAPLPALAASILPGHPLPRPWSVAAAGLLGLGAHFANVLPDLTEDTAAGVGGLPQRVAAATGERAVRIVALLLLLTATVLVAFAPGATYRWPVLVGLGAALALGLVGLRASGRTPFRCAMGIAGITVLMFLFGGADLV